MLTVGEVHTGLLQHATALSPSQCARLLSFREGESVLRSERPTAYAVSPDMLTGVDCRMPSLSGRQVRGAGTVSAHTIMTGGRILQGSARTTITRGRGDRRLQWSHYLSLPGKIEAVGRVDWTDVRAGFIGGRPGPSSLDIAAISARAMGAVQQSTYLDRRPPIRANRTVLRWAISEVDSDKDETSSAFTMRSDTVRTLDLVVARGQVADAIALCEDLALHDWLLTTLAELLNLTLTSSRPTAEKITRLRPAIEHLLHLWMPASRVSDDVLSIWEGFEQRPGFTRQWNASVSWIRDQIAIATMALLQAVRLDEEAAQSVGNT